MKIGMPDGGYIENSTGFVGAENLRREYHKAGLELRKAERALANSIKESDRKRLEEECEKARAYCLEVEKRVIGYRG